MKQESAELMSHKSNDSMDVTHVSFNDSMVNQVNGGGEHRHDNYRFVDHKNLLLDDIGKNLMSSEIADFSFLIEDCYLPAHKFLLASRSNYFKKLVIDVEELTLDFASRDSLGAILKYMYTGELNLSEYELEIILEMLELAKKFELPSLVSSLAGYLKGSVNIDNVWFIYNTGLTQKIESLVDHCLFFMDTHATDVLHHETTLKQRTVDNLKMLFQRSTFFAPEVEKFQAAYNWINKNPKEDQKGILQLISLEKLGQEELLETVRPTRLINDSAILDAIDTRKRKRSRLSIDSGTNTEQFKFDVSAYAFTPKCSIKTVKHETEAGCFYYLAEFPEPFEINHIKMRLSELISNKGEFSYYVEVSLDNTDWTKIIDYSRVICRSWQHLYFDLTLVKYIRVIGTKVNGHPNDIILDSFEAKKLVTNIPEYTKEGFVIPNADLANLEVGTRIKYPANRHDLYLLHSTQSFACFIPVRSFGSDMKKNTFTIQFSQPYQIDSMEFKIYYKERDFYKYYIEVSLDEQNWEIIDDKREEGARGMQKLKFDARPVTFIRIVGVESVGPGASKFIGCSLFKCPADL